MAQPSKQRPWVVEMQPPATEKWFPMDAYRDKAEATMQAALMRRRTKGKAMIRVTQYQEST